MRTHRWTAVAILVLVSGCGGNPSTRGDADEDVVPDEREGEIVEDADADPDSSMDADDSADASVEEAVEDAAEEDAGMEPMPASCFDEPPPGSPVPDPLPAYPGECPLLVSGRNAIASSGSSREFLLVVPADLDPVERLPVVFLWHWIGGDAQGFLVEGEVQAAVDTARFIAIIPEEKGDLLLKWPYMAWDAEVRLEEEATFFDDLLACAAEQYNVNASCVSSVGVSSGALWTSQLAQRRSRVLSSFLSLSGGVGQAGDWLNPVRPWSGAEHVLPAVVLWGGPTDFCGVSFASTSDHLEEALVAGGHFILECVHNCSHAEPPLEAPPGGSRYSMLWDFIFSHPYWLGPGESPYFSTGLPASFPPWCGIGAASAVIRTGPCEGGLLGDCL